MTGDNAYPRLRFLTSRDPPVPPEYLHNPDQPTTSDADSSHLCLDPIDLSIADEANSDIPLARPPDHLENPLPMISIENNESRDSTASQTDEARKRRSCNLRTNTVDDQEFAGNVAETRTRRRKEHSCAEQFLSEEFDETQMARLQKLAEKTSVIQMRGEKSSQYSQLMILAAFALNVGHSSSLMYLKDLIDGYQTSAVDIRRLHESDPMRMSPTSRMLEINSLDCQIAFHCFLRTFHLYKLISENRYGLQEAENPFLVNGVEHHAFSPSKNRGNPRQQQRAQPCKLMMRDLFPELPEDHPSYSTKYRKVVTMRKTSCRLQQLSSRFGTGLFGLVPLDGIASDPMIGLLNYS